MKEVTPIRRFKMGKLVRDKIPDRLQSQGGKVILQTISPEDMLHYLKLKLKEEAEEVFTATQREDLKEELADVLETVSALVKNQGLEMEDIEKIRLQKRKERGGFEKGLFLELIEVETLDPSHPLIQYCLARPSDYPEIPNFPHSLSAVDDETCQ